MQSASAANSTEGPPRRILVAGATGVIGSRLLPLLARSGHVVAGMSRSTTKSRLVRSLGAEPVVCDVYDGSALTDAMTSFRPDLPMRRRPVLVSISTKPPNAP